MNTLFYIVKLVFDICLLRRSPEDLPYSNIFLILVVILSAIVSILISSMIYDFTLVVMATIAGLFFSFVFVKVLLLKNPERFLQTFSAILACVTLINVLFIPFIYVFVTMSLSDTAKVFIGLVRFLFLIWIVMVCGHIFSKATMSGRGSGIGLSIIYLIMNIMITEYIFMESTAT